MRIVWMGDGKTYAAYITRYVSFDEDGRKFIVFKDRIGHIIKVDENSVKALEKQEGEQHG